MVADSFDEAEVRVDEKVEAELGVIELGGFESDDLVKELLSIERPSRGFEGRPEVAGAAGAGAGAGASYALEKVLRIVGETALRVSRRRLVEPLPNVRLLRSG